MQVTLNKKLIHLDSLTLWVHVKIRTVVVNALESRFFFNQVVLGGLLCEKLQHKPWTQLLNVQYSPRLFALFDGHQEERPACNICEWWVLAWLSVCSEVQMVSSILSRWCHCHPIISCFIKIQNSSAFLVDNHNRCEWVNVSSDTSSTKSRQP